MGGVGLLQGIYFWVVWLEGVVAGKQTPVGPLLPLSSDDGGARESEQADRRGSTQPSTAPKAWPMNQARSPPMPAMTMFSSPDLTQEVLAT
jgi:hypothetical protein